MLDLLRCGEMAPAGRKIGDARHVWEGDDAAVVETDALLARKQGVRLDDGSVIAFPYMPRVADLPTGWRHFSAAQKIEHLIGLDRCYEILSWPWAGLDPLCLSMKMQVMRVLLPIGIKAALDGSLDRELARERDRAVVLDELGRKFGTKGGGGLA